MAAPNFNLASMRCIPRRRKTDGVCRQRGLVLTAFFCVLFNAVPSFAGAEISLPLRGYFRPGKYMPVRVLTTDAHALTLQASGAIPTTLLAPTPGVQTIAPLLPVRSQVGPIVSSGLTGAASPVSPLRALAPTERLIGVSMGSAGFAERSLFPGLQIVAIELDAADPLPGPIAAWEALDAVVLNRFPERAVVTRLLAAGTVIAVETSALPNDGLPWEHVENDWVLRCPINGPTGVMASDAYNPSLMWNPGHPWNYRRQVLLIAAAFCMIILAASMWRSPWAAASCVAICVAASLAMIQWRRSQSPVMEANGAVLISADSLTQRDDWLYRRSLEPNAEASVAVAGLFKPILDTERQIDQADLRLEVDPGDREVLRFKYRLAPDRTLAFLARRVTSGRWPGTPTRPLESPLSTIRDLYLDSVTELRGSILDPLPGNVSPPSNVQRWPALYIDRLKNGAGLQTLQP